MRQQVLASLLVVALVLAPLTPTVQAQDWKNLALELARRIIRLWRKGEHQILGHRCNYIAKPKIIRWRLWHKGTWPVQDGPPSLEKTRERNLVETITITDFFKKAFKAGLINESDAQRMLY